MTNFKQIESVRNNVKYSCKGEVIFRTALLLVMEHGANNFKDNNWLERCMSDIDKRHDEMELKGSIAWMTRDFEKALFECAAELAQIEPAELFKFIQENWMFYSYDNISYERSIELLKDAMEYIEEAEKNKEDVIDSYKCIGFLEEEIDQLGFNYILEECYN